MPEALAGLAGGAMGLIGTAMTNSANVDMMREQSQFSANEATKTRDWQEWMADTSYRRAMNDMHAAGLNPMLAFSQGGAAVPSGATGSAAAPAKMENLISGMSSGAQDAIRTAKAVESQTAAIDLTKEQTSKTAQDTSVAKMTEQKVKADTLKTMQEKLTEEQNTHQASTKTQLLDTSVPQLLQEMKRKYTNDKIDSNEYLQWLNRAADLVNKLSGAASNASRAVVPMLP